MRSRANPAIAAFSAALCAALLSACVPLTEKQPALPPVPQITEAQLRAKAADSLAQGIRQYEAGSYDDALKNFTASLDHGGLSREDQSVARKHLAFIHCVSARTELCRAEFRKAFEVNAQFELSAAEAGHPLWGTIYANVRAQMVAPSPPSTPRKALTKPEQLLADGMEKYEAGEFEAAFKLFQSALAEGLTAKADRVKAIKHGAFSHCLLNRTTLCRAEFVKIFDLDPKFDLSPAEAGHPSWRNTFAGVKQQAREMAAERQAAEAKEAAANNAAKANAKPAAGKPATPATDTAKKK